MSKYFDGMKYFNGDDDAALWRALHDPDFRELLSDKGRKIFPLPGENPKEETFYDRLLAESRELENKIEKLEAFIHGDGYNAIDGEQQGLLGIQLAPMRQYADTLAQRIRLIVTATGSQRSVEEIDQGVTLVGGDQRETPIPFK